MGQNRIVPSRCALAQFRAAFQQANHTYNHYRPHQKLDNLTPAQYLARLQQAQSQML
jgi:transposase InsO family protein